MLFLLGLNKSCASIIFFFFNILPQTVEIEKRVDLILDKKKKPNKHEVSDMAVDTKICLNRILKK